MSDFFFLDVRSQRNFALDKWIRLLYGASKRFLKRIKLLSENANSLKFYFYFSRHLPRRLGNYSEGWQILAAVSLVGYLILRKIGKMKEDLSFFTEDITSCYFITISSDTFYLVTRVFRICSFKF